MHEGQRYSSSPKRDGCMRPTSRREAGRDGKGRANGVEERLLCVLDGRSMGVGDGLSVASIAVALKNKTIFFSVILIGGRESNPIFEISVGG